MKIQSGTLDSAITAGASDPITDMPELLGAFLPMLLALPTQRMPDDMIVSFSDEKSLAGEPIAPQLMDGLKDINVAENPPLGLSMELMAMLNASVPMPITPESQASFTAMANHPVSTSIAIPVSVEKPLIPTENQPSGEVLELKPSQISLPMITTLNPTPNNPLNEPLPLADIFSNEQITKPRDHVAPVASAAEMVFMKQALGIEQKRLSPVTTTIEPIVDSLSAVNVMAPSITESASEVTFCHNLLNTTVDFFNKQLMPTDNPVPLASSTIPSATVNTTASINPEKIIALEALQYNASQLTSLKTGNYSARLKVSPPDAGPITADILIHKGTTDVTLRCDNPSVRHFLEMHLQPLKESFQQSTLQLGHVAIQAHFNETSSFHHSSSEHPAFVDYSSKSPEKNAQKISALSEEPKPSLSQSIIDTWV